MTAVELLEVNPDADTQLVLPDETFEIIRNLRDSGAMTATSFLLSDPEMLFDTFENLGTFLGRVNRSCAWWIGDWIVFGEGTYGETFAQALAATGLSEQTLLQRAMVCRAIPPNRRKANLSFAVHVVVHKLDAKERDLWLNRAAKGGWTAAELKERMKASRKDTHPPLVDDAEVDEARVVEVARMIANTAVPLVDGQHYQIRTEDLVQLKAALGLEGE